MWYFCLQYSSQILKHLCDFPLPNVDLGIAVMSISAPKYMWLNIGEGEGAHLSENKGVKSECKKFGENLRQMASVSVICDEDCRLTRWPAEGIEYKVFSPGKL